MKKRLAGLLLWFFIYLIAWAVVLQIAILLIGAKWAALFWLGGNLFVWEFCLEDYRGTRGRWVFVLGVLLSIAILALVAYAWDAAGRPA